MSWKNLLQFIHVVLCTMTLSSCSTADVAKQSATASMSQVESILPLRNVTWIGSAPETHVNDALLWPANKSQPFSDGVSLTFDAHSLVGKWIEITTEFSVPKYAWLGFRYRILGPQGYVFVDPTAEMSKCHYENENLTICSHLLFVASNSEQIVVELRAKELPFVLHKVTLSLGSDVDSRKLNSDTLGQFTNVIALMKSRFIRTKDVDWQKLTAEASPWLENPDDYGLPQAIAWIVSRIPSGNHSFVFLTALQRNESSSPPKFIDVKVLEGKYGYLKLGSMSGDASKLVDVVRKANVDIDELRSQGIESWIVDLRGNSGGNFFAMLVSLAPILREGAMGYFISNDGALSEFGLTRDGAYASKPNNPSDKDIVFPMPTEISFKEPPVHVFLVINKTCQSACETLAIASRSLPYATLIGSPTGGFATSNEVIPIDKKFSLALTVGYEADAKGTRIFPDVQPAVLLGSYEDPINWITNKKIK